MFEMIEKKIVENSEEYKKICGERDLLMSAILATAQSCHNLMTHAKLNEGPIRSETEMELYNAIQWLLRTAKDDTSSMYWKNTLFDATIKTGTW